MELLFSSGSMVYTGECFSGVYGIQNHVNGKWYVGESGDVENRVKKYIKGIGKDQILIKRAIEKYGIESFSCYKLEEADFEILHDREVYWGTTLNSLSPSGYNLQLGGSGKSITSAETRKKKSDARIGIQFSKETLVKMSLARKGKPPANKGKKASDEIRKQMSLSRKGMPSGWKGKTPSIITREKMSLAKIGRPPPNKGKKMTEEQLNKMRTTKLINWLEKEAPWFCEIDEQTIGT